MREEKGRHRRHQSGFSLLHRAFRGDDEVTMGDDNFANGVVVGKSSVTRLKFSS